MKDFINFLINRIRLVWHFRKHRKYEIWTLDFIDDREPHGRYYYSDHTITCSKCKIVHPAYRVWIKEYSDFSLDKAREKALRLTGEKN